MGKFYMIAASLLFATLSLSSPASASKEGIVSLVKWGRTVRDDGGQPEVAEVGFDAAIDRAPTWVLPYLERAEVAIGRNEGYSEVRAEILALGPERYQNPRLHRILGQLASLEGDEQVALASLRRSLELRQEQPQARAELAGVLSKLGRHGEAADEYKRALTELPHDDAIRSRYADTLEAAQRHGEARKQLEILVDRQPGKEAPLRRLARFLERRGDRRGAAAISAKADAIQPGGDRKLRPLPPAKR